MIYIHINSELYHVRERTRICDKSTTTHREKGTTNKIKDQCVGRFIVSANKARDSPVSGAGLTNLSRRLSKCI